MIDFRHMWPVIIGQGWSKAAFVMCLVLLQRHVVTFEQCLILLLAGVLLGGSSETLSKIRQLKEDRGSPDDLPPKDSAKRSKVGAAGEIGEIGAARHRRG